MQQILCEAPQAAVFSAAPHGVSAGLIDTLLSAAADGRHAAARGRYLGRLPLRLRRAPTRPSTGTRTARRGAWRSSPARCPSTCDSLATPHVGHPGCFATAILLASVPLLASGLVTPALFVSGVTGSTGSGRKPVDGTHHPLRHGDLYSYSALAHRHVPEIAACARAASGVEAEFAFVPHSGPFARGIHVTVQARLRRPLDTEKRARRRCATSTRDAPFVRVSAAGAAREGSRGQQLRAPLRGGRWPHRRGDVRHRQSQQGRRGRRRAVDEPHVRPAARPPGSPRRRRAGPDTSCHPRATPARGRRARLSGAGVFTVPARGAPPPPACG